MSETRRQGTRTRLAVLALAASLGPGVARGEIVDRIAAIVGLEAITLSQVGSELRLVAMLNRAETEETPEATAEAIRRLIDRRLVLQDMAATPFLLAEPAEVERQLGQLREETYLGGMGFAAALTHYGLTLKDVQAVVEERIAFERYVSFRFKIGLNIDAGDVESYYREQYAATLRERGLPVEPLASVSAAISEILLERQANELMTERMKELRALTVIRVLADPRKGRAP